jgi:zinc protease
MPGGSENSSHCSLSFFSTAFNLFYSRRITHPALALKVTGKEKGFSLGALFAKNESASGDRFQLFAWVHLALEHRPITLILAGDFHKEDVRELAERHFGSLPPACNSIPRVDSSEPEQNTLREMHKCYPMAPLPAIASSFHLPPLGHRDSYALEIAAMVLSAGQSSRLYRRLVYESQSALSASGQAFFLEGPSLFFSFAICNQGRDIVALHQEMQEIFQELKDGPVQEEELLKAKNHVVRDFIFGRQTLEQRAGFLGKMAVLRKDPSLYSSSQSSLA